MSTDSVSPHSDRVAAPVPRVEEGLRSISLIVPAEHGAYEGGHAYPIHEFQAVLHKGASVMPVILALESRLQREGLEAKIHTKDPFYADIIITVERKDLERATEFMNQFNAGRASTKSL